MVVLCLVAMLFGRYVLLFIVLLCCENPSCRCRPCYRLKANLKVSLEPKQMTQPTVNH